MTAVSYTTETESDRLRRRGVIYDPRSDEDPDAPRGQSALKLLNVYGSDFVSALHRLDLSLGLPERK